jgi:hypothetical protein
MPYQENRGDVSFDSIDGLLVQLYVGWDYLESDALDSAEITGVYFRRQRRANVRRHKKSPQGATPHVGLNVCGRIRTTARTPASLPPP